MPQWIILAAVTIHVILTAVLYLLMRRHRLHVQTIIMPLVALIPLFGPICAVLVHFFHATPERHRRLDLEKMQLNEELYKSIFVEETGETDRIVPLGEALLMNDPHERRRLMMDILEDDPAQYVALLDQAKLNDDPEVTHHATTALVELVKEYDLRLQKVEQRYARDPHDMEAVQAYCDFLREYIDSNLCKGQMERVQRQQYGQLLQQLIASKTHRTRQHYEAYVANAMALEDYGDAQEMLDRMFVHWPDWEESWMLRLRLQVLLRSGDGLQHTLRQIRQRGIYLNSQNRATVEFWEGNAV